MNDLECAPPSAAPTQPAHQGGIAGNGRGGLQPPHTVLGAERIPDGSSRKFQRTVTFRLEPTKEQYALLKLRDAQAAQRMNRYSVQLFAERNGWRPPEDSPRDTLTKHGRLERDDLSSSIYVACEKRVTNDWRRIGKRIWSGVQIPTYRKGCLPFDSGKRSDKGGSCGIEIVTTPDGGYAAKLHVTADYAEGDNWITVPLSRRTELDELRAIKAAEFANGTCHILNGYVRFRKEKVLLTVAFNVTRNVPPVGSRVATLSEFEDGRLLLRSEFQTIDFTSKLNALKSKKEHWDGIRRRFSRKLMRSKGSSRRLREKLDLHSFSRRAATEMHDWSRKMIDWAASQGCGTFVVAHLIGSDWPAHDLKAKLKYKAEEVGLRFEEPSLEQEPTERAAKAAVKKKQRKARKLGDALREVSDQLGDSRI